MNAVPDTLIMKGELSLEKRCILNWDHGKKIEYLEEKGKKQSLKLYLVSHGDRYGGSQCGHDEGDRIKSIKHGGTTYAFDYDGFGN